MDSLEGKVLLVTGGTGSFGRELTEMVLKKHQPSALRVFSRDEVKQLEMRRWLSDPRLRFLIGDVRDKGRLDRAMRGVDIVVHAAALKQVPVAEYNPMEAIKTNIMGAANVIDTAIDNNVEKVVFVSTDKAVHPVNLYGATKLVAEKLFIQANAYAGRERTRFSCVRYGNVVGSRGSVISLFGEGRKNGVIRITDERMTRFWITLRQVARFVIDSIRQMIGGEIFVPKIPSMRLVDIAHTIAPEAQWEVIGVRPGEKLDEILITREEAPRTKEFKTYYVIEPQHPFWNPVHVKGGTPVPEEFEYRSDTNTWWLRQEDMASYLQTLMDEP
ncbi:MAG: UDP-N-acetylglucosamine 4,6-dehydratase (inverting) [Candidatus Binatia bacterium]